MGVRSGVAGSRWPTWLLAGGLVALFAGERILGDFPSARLVLSGIGGLAALGAAVWRALSWRASEGEERGVEGILLAGHAGVLLALLLYLVSTDEALGRLAPGLTATTAGERLRGALAVLWPIMLAVAFFPSLAAEWALGARRRRPEQRGGVEGRRVRETATGALTVALAGAFLMVVGYVTSARDKTLDLSYFKTATPGESTLAIVEGMDPPLEVLLFFPDVNPVKDEVLGYFQALRDATGRVVVESYDRMVSPELAREERVTRDGTVLLRRGSVREQISLPAELAPARRQLRRLDQEVQQRLTGLTRHRRTAYLTVGHGELNDVPPDSLVEVSPLREVRLLSEILGALNYTVEDLGLREGLGREVPDDAAMVLVLGPAQPFLDSELEALAHYLDGGGAVLLALDPEGGFELGPLEERLGVRYAAVPLADDRQYLRQRGGPSDHQLIVTDRFSAHASVTTLSRAAVGAAVLLVGAGYIEAIGGGAVPHPSFVMRSLPSTFTDLDGDFEHDGDTEQRRSWNLAAAIEGPEPQGAAADSSDAAPGPARAEGPGRMRALVYADADLFSDAVLVSIRPNAALLADGLRWLGGDESLAGEITSEEDVPIVHTQAEDVAWFYSIILGAPTLVLAAGLAGAYARRRRTPEVGP